MKKQLRSRCRPHVEKLENRVAPLSLMGLGLAGALMFSPDEVSATESMLEDDDGLDERQTAARRSFLRANVEPRLALGKATGLPVQEETDRRAARDASRSFISERVAVPNSRPRAHIDLAADSLNAQNHSFVTNSGQGREANDSNRARANDALLNQPLRNQNDNALGRGARGGAQREGHRRSSPTPDRPRDGVESPDRNDRDKEDSQEAVSSSTDATVQLATPETDVISPHQRTTPTEGMTFEGKFIVELRQGVDSEQVAGEHGYTHEYHYNNLPQNINIWRIDEDRQSRGRGNAIDRSARAQDKEARRLSRAAEVLDAYPIYETPAEVKSFLSDPLYPAQWHLTNAGQTGGTAGVDANAAAAWEQGITGKGVTIGVVDSGTDLTHPDLNIDLATSWDFIAGTDDGAPTSASAHGTAVAGVSGAIGDNSVGTTGVAPDATVGAMRAIGGTSDIPAALTWSTVNAASGSQGFDGSTIDVYNNSWGPSRATLHAERALSDVADRAIAVSESVTNGRGGLGSIFVFAAGNEREDGGNVNYDWGFTHSRRVVSVAAVGHDGTIADYSTPGAAILVGATSSDGASSEEATTTTDIQAGVGYRDFDYTDGFNGTSSAAPVVSGVIALMLEANPNLTYRDAQHILVKSASRQGLTPTTFAANQSGREFSHDFGFGLVNAGGAVNLATNWEPVGPELLVSTGVISASTAIAEHATNYTESTVTVSPQIRVESVEVIVNATHAQKGELDIELQHVGSTTTTSTLALNRSNDNTADYSNYIFHSRAHFGEDSSGTWKLRLRDSTINGTTGTLDDWTLRIYGTEMTDDGSPRAVSIEVPADQIREGSLSSFRVRFDEPIDTSTFTSPDIVVTRIVSGSGTSVSVGAPAVVSGSNDTAFDVSLTSAQTIVGNYQIDIGPNIADKTGNLLNQDGDTTSGEASDDVLTEFATIGSYLVFSNGTRTAIPDQGAGGDPLNQTLSLPAVDVADLDVLFDIRHPFVSRHLDVSLTAPGATTSTGDDVTVLVAARNSSNTSGFTGNDFNGYRDVVLDDDNGSAPLISAFVGTDGFPYVGQHRPSNSLTSYDVSHAADDWTLTVDDAVSGNTGTLWNYSLIITPTSTFDISIDSVTNTDSDRDNIEVVYSVGDAEGGNGTAPEFNFGVFESTDPFFNFNSDESTGTFTVTDIICTDAGSGCLTGGPHTVELPVSVFPDPSFTRNQELFSLVVADPNHNILDHHRSNNQGILEGVSVSTDGTLYIAGKPFESNTVTVTSGNVAFNTFPTISYTVGNVNDIFFTGGVDEDTFSASGVNEEVLAFLGPDDDTFTGGNFTNAVQGGPGNDTLTGGNGDDRLYGMGGNDSVSGGAGADLLSVGPGSISGGTQTLDGGTGNDYFFIDGTQLNERITVWDPDDNTGAAGTSLN